MREARGKEQTRTYIVAKGEAKNDITYARGHVAATASGQLHASRQRTFSGMSRTYSGQNHEGGMCGGNGPAHHLHRKRCSVGGQLRPSYQSQTTLYPYEASSFPSLSEHHLGKEGRKEGQNQERGLPF